MLKVVIGFPKKPGMKTSALMTVYSIANHFINIFQESILH